MSDEYPKINDPIPGRLYCDGQLVDEISAPLVAVTDNAAQAWMTPGGDVSRSYEWCKERCLPGVEPSPLFYRQQPSPQAPVEPLTDEQIIEAIRKIDDLAMDHGLAENKLPDAVAIIRALIGESMNVDVSGMPDLPLPLEEVRGKFRGEFDYVEAGNDYCNANQVRDYGLKCRRATLATKQAPKEAKRCEYCDGSGDVHDQTGEWRGTCACIAAVSPQGGEVALNDSLTYQELESLYRAQCKLTDEIGAKLEAGSDTTLSARIAELESDLATMNNRYSAALAAPASLGEAKAVAPAFWLIRWTDGDLSAYHHFPTESAANEFIKSVGMPNIATAEPYYAVPIAPALPVAAEKDKQRNLVPLSDLQIDRHVDAVLRASGSGLKNYSMQKTLDGMRSAMLDAMLDALQQSPAGGGV